MPQLSIYFTTQDLARLRVCPGPHTLWELVLSLHRLQPCRPSGAPAPRMPPGVARWRADTLSALAGRRLGHHVQRHLLPLTPVSSYFPDFLTPYAGTDGLDQGLDTLLSTPRRRIEDELDRLATRSGAPSWGAELAAGDLSALHLLGDTMRAYFNTALAPSWPAIADRIAVERTRLTGIRTTSGIDAMLSHLSPTTIWHPRERILRAPYPVSHSIRLQGRGLTLIPSWFCSGPPVAFADPALPPVLLYSVGHTPAQLAESDPDALAKLIGHTRAAILLAITTGTPTDAILRRTAISASQLSRHAAVLKNNNLITEARHAGRTFYTRTPLGNALTASA
ncbi:ArsR/SmtB family transcription factor [Actinomadura terrae]|uniref:ArsR/SmtB family transcription factor n=1 Tax=Actinomadura terrae TaxID=604353 RepID=UPI001FA743D8|nr:winged helix-turn-helix domain-containing protein [Actinomadura terrae]